jgi:hypothetical protein
MAAMVEHAHGWSRSGIPIAVEVALVVSPRFTEHVGGRTRRAWLGEAPCWTGHGGGAGRDELAAAMSLEQSEVGKGGARMRVIWASWRRGNSTLRARHDFDA